MTRSIDGVATQVLGREELDNYVIPPEVVDGLQADEELVVVLQDPLPERVRRVLGFVVVDFLVTMLNVVVGALLGRPVPYQDPIEIAAPAGEISEGEEVVLDVTAAVVDETTARGETVDRTMHLYQAI